MATVENLELIVEPVHRCSMYIYFISLVYWAYLRIFAYCEYEYQQY